ncbi:MAG: Crp/Fnr family transcriptional regulator [Bifidobacteriaceae bacterium]|jgi:CRP-like cAMP-binding protein|nr:Crp/Fnr family transcriptional regulator [Bifidobacteriaceae bacterium]
MELADYYESVKSAGIRRQYAKGDVLLCEGDVAHRLFFVERGGLRLWHNDDGRDITVQFFFEGHVVSSFESLYLKVPSLFSISCIENSDVTVVDGTGVLQDAAQSPEMMRIVANHISHRFIDYTKYFLDRIEKAPEDRYRSLAAREPELVSRVPQHELASYLGITPVSLSRIKRRIDTDTSVEAHNN